MPPFTFDFTNKTVNIKYVSEQEAERTRKEIKNRCPYQIPTIDEIYKLIESASYRVNKYKLIEDIFACGALAISNLVDLSQKADREEQYKQIITKYEPKEQQLMSEIFGKIFALLSSVTYDNGVFNDYLGELFMRCNMGNKNCGQFFTPYHISEFMARCTITDKIDKVVINNEEILTVCDPCCGSAGLMMAVLDVLKNQYNVNYTHNCFIECSDIDIRCVHMAFLQLSLAGVPAIIYHRDSLSMETWSVWKTPAFILQYMRFYKYEERRA